MFKWNNYAVYLRQDKEEGGAARAPMHSLWEFLKNAVQDFSANPEAKNVFMVLK